MPFAEPRSLWSTLREDPSLDARALWAADGGVALGDLRAATSLGGALSGLRGRSVLLATRDQLTAALALIELDGVARRLVLCPPDVPVEHVPFIAATAEVDAVVSDRDAPDAAAPAVGAFVTCRPALTAGSVDREPLARTDWILLTSGTTGRPKLVEHTLASLAGAIQPAAATPSPVWSTFYDIRRYGGLQIFLRAILGSGSMVLSSADEPTGNFLIRAGHHGVTHISGTPSHWRRALMSPSARRMRPGYVRLSGEIADQAILDALRACYPEARVAHAFASTEAGVAFDVNDGLAGFPASLLEATGGGVSLKVEGGSLRIRSSRTAARYLGPGGGLADADGFVDTGDMLERRGERYYFVGRRGGIINVGGLKVHPEEIEAVINTHPDVRMSLVRTRKNPITGAVVVADVVPKGAPDGTLQHAILERCRERLPRHKVPAIINVVAALPVAASGKLVRHGA